MAKYRLTKISLVRRVLCSTIVLLGFYALFFPLFIIILYNLWDFGTLPQFLETPICLLQLLFKSLHLIEVLEHFSTS